MLKYYLIIISSMLSIGGYSADYHDKARLIVTTDIGGADPDDMQSLIHLLMCSDRVDIEGLISAPAWVSHPDNTGKIRDAVAGYGKVLTNLSRHSCGYPPAEYLNSIIARGQENPHMSGVGEGKDSPGSELIIKAVIDDGDPRPVWIAAWGGINTLAQAIWKVRNTRTETEFNKFISKLRIYDILGQDDAGAWIAKNFPGITYIRNTHVYGWAPGDKWTKENIQNKGNIGKLYPDRIWATEGDSPSFLYLLANGLNVPEHPDYGGWGGRFSLDKAQNLRGMDFIVKSGKDESVYDDYYMLTSANEGVEAINLWKGHIKNDFATRIIWATESDFDKANHHPTAIINGQKGLWPVSIEAKAGKPILLDAGKSNDPDNDTLKYKWTFYKEPSSYNGEINLAGADSSACTVTVPSESQGNTVHIILEVSDNGEPSLTSYRRVIISVK